MAKNEERRTWLDNLLGRPGAADEIEQQLEETEEALEGQGVQHKGITMKELDEDEARLVKALRDIQNQRIEMTAKANLTTDDVIDLVVATLEQLSENPPEGDVDIREAVAAIVGPVLESMEPTEELALDVETEERAGEFDEDDEETKAAKLDLFATMSDDTAATLEAVQATQKMLAALQNIPSNMEALTERLIAVEKQLASRPRATENADTVFTLDRVEKLVDVAKKAENNPDELVTVAGLTGMLAEPIA